MKRRMISAVAGVLFATSAFAQAPAITGQPVIDSPQLLAWPRDFGPGDPDLSEPTANTLNDLHGTAGNCDLVLSTEGNYHMALHELWMQYLQDYPDDGATRLYTTSPPISPGQIANGGVRFGNFTVNCRPQVAVGNMKVMGRLQALGALDSAPVPLYVNNGSVILVKRGNPKHIHTVWDLGRRDVRIVTPNPVLEPNAFNTYANAIFDIAANDATQHGGDATRLFDRIFNGASHDPYKWLAGSRIHHREVPWSIAYGRADAGLILYHLAKYIKESFPDQFDIVPLGGTVDNPQPLPGNATATTYIALINGTWTSQQLAARDHLYAELMSPTFTSILQQHGLKRP